MKPNTNKAIPGVNVRAPWARLIIEGKKTIETRFYRLPDRYVNRPVFLIETPGPRGRFKSRVVGIVFFGESFRYAGASAFYADADRHLVTPSSAEVNWKAGEGKHKWGWPILKAISFDARIPPNARRGIVFASSIPVEVPAELLS